MKAQTLAQTRTPFPPLHPPPRSFDKQRIHDAMNEDEREESRRIETINDPDERRWESLVAACGLVGRLEKENPEHLYAAESPQPKPAYTSGQQQLQHEPTMGSEQAFQDRHDRERTLSESPAPSSRGSNRTPLPVSNSSKRGAPPPLPGHEDVAQSPPSKKPRVAKTKPEKKKPIDAKSGKETRRDTTKNENARADKIEAEGFLNPYGPCNACKNTDTPCKILFDGRRCGRCTRSKGSSKKCLSGQINTNPRILEAERARRAAAGFQVGPPLPPVSHHHQSLGRSNDPNPPDQIDSNGTDNLPG
ncbi:hypothetical protein PG985_004671 [Apiospora marii]|uniref:Zn(2)-C6 fungal-type domain-containing protein n=1 Tax=Apiospora marii TaxID=335849 RepID=A0ABR1SA08_9PEZI